MGQLQAGWQEHIENSILPFGTSNPRRQSKVVWGNVYFDTYVTAVVGHRSLPHPKRKKNTKPSVFDFTACGVGVSLVVCSCDSKLHICGPTACLRSSRLRIDGLYVQSKHLVSSMPSHFQPNVSDEYLIEEFSYPTALNYCQQPSLFSAVMEVASLQIQIRFLSTIVF